MDHGRWIMDDGSWTMGDGRLNRRAFLRRAGLAAGAVAVAPFAIGGRAAPDPIGVGIVGVGSRGSGLLRIVRALDGLRCRAVCDVLDFRLAAAAEAAGPDARAYVDYRALLDDRAVEAVLLCTPFGLHGPMALDVLAAGRHLYCEKTLARGADLPRVLAAAASHPALTVQTGHQYHSSALYREVKRYVDAGYLGELTGVHCQWNRNHDWRREVPSDRPELERAINWRMYREHSGGLVAELMSHQIDFVNWVTGAHPTRVSGQGGVDHYRDGRETLDNAHLQLAYPGGLDATFSCTTASRYGGYEICLLGKEATVVLKRERATIYTERRGPVELGTVDGVTGATITAWSAGEGVPVDADGNHPTRQALAEFRDCIREGRQPEADVRSGALTARCVDLGIRAAREQTTLVWG